MIQAALLYFINDSNLETKSLRDMEDSREQSHSLDWKDKKYVFVCCQIIHQLNATLQFLTLP